MFNWLHETAYKTTFDIQPITFQITWGKVVAIIAIAVFGVLFHRWLTLPKDT